MQILILFFNKTDSQWRKNFSREKIIHASQQIESDLNVDFCMQEIKIALRQIKKSSSPGQDKIHYDILKHLHQKALQVLLDLYNLIWESGKIPADWKHSIVIPIYKPDKPKSDPKSYRPIALTSFLCKLMEKLIANRLTWYLESNNLLNNRQSGFRKNRSTLDQLHRIQDSIFKAINNNQSCIAVMFDFEKAYDMLHKEGLLHKIRKLGLDGNMYMWIEDFLTNRSIQVRLGSSLSKVTRLENGTPQGSAISPLLFLLMINDFPPPTDSVDQSLFADDSAIWRSGTNLNSIGRSIQKNIDSIADWCSKWGIKISTTKTTAIIFTRKRRTELDTPLHIHQEPIKMESKVKFLGLIFDSKLYMDRPHKICVRKMPKTVKNSALPVRDRLGFEQVDATNHIQNTDPIMPRLREPSLSNRLKIAQKQA